MPIIIEKENYQYVPVWDSLYFTGFASQDSYYIYVQIEGWEHHPSLRQGDSAVIAQQAGESSTKVYGPGGRQLILFMGNRRICNLGDTLKDPYAYPLMVQVVDSAGNGINGDTIWFKADYGKFGNQSSVGFITATVNYGDSTLDGIAGPSEPFPYIFPNEPRDIMITVEAMKGTNIWATKQVALRCFNDPELSGLNPPKCHETTDAINKNVEIPGDGYNDGTSKKTIKVEIDYASDIIHVDGVRSGISYMKEILVTAKLDTTDMNFIIDEGFDGLDPIPSWMVKTYLAGFRDFRDHIHIVIGSRRENTNDLGDVVAYNLSDWGGFKHTKCAHLASTDSAIAHLHLDSTGILIYAGRICDEWWSISFDTLFHYGWTSWYKALGVAMAHEIGHALGILTHDSTGVMQARINWKKNASTYMYFVDSLLNKRPPEDAINTRDVLGIHTIDVGW